MKKLVSCVVLIAMLPVVFVSCFDLDKQADKTTNEKEEKPARMNISKNPEAFNTAFDSLMQSYYRVKNALINWDSLAAGNEAKSLAQLSEQLPVNTLQADSSLVLTAHNFTDAISSLRAINWQQQTTIEAKRRAFSTSCPINCIVLLIRFGTITMLFITICARWLLAKMNRRTG